MSNSFTFRIERKAIVVRKMMPSRLVVQRVFKDRKAYSRKGQEALCGAAD